MTRAWYLRRKKDRYYRDAKKEGYRSRAAYKLFQLNEKCNILFGGDVVVDLGAAPGGWSQAARELVGPRGFVLGVDLVHVKPLPFENVCFMKLDIRQADAPTKILAVLPRKADVVLSDASPNISGVWSLDQTLSAELVLCAVKIARNVLRPGGRFAAKIFQGVDTQNVKKELSKLFEYTKITKPPASRKRSAETYLVAKDFIG
ncbi:MAG: 23S rRNA (uridine(2552)-2'-O)-methyltransferase [Methanobacteriota archaeon]|nr:MAG: 23S rRNA (uridine(2552)-2'-O)-methyltransferase [Euryarchaeota archaeon]